MTTQIKFGTDGWRGVIADDYTFDNVRRVGNAMAHYVHAEGGRGEGPGRRLRHAFRLERVRRRLSRKFWRRRASSCTSPTTTRPLPRSPTRWRTSALPAAVMITSSHNPFNWNGVKYKAGYGGSGTPAIIKAIESALDGPQIERSGGRITSADFKTPYIEAIKKFVDLDAIKKAGFKFAIDAMYGSGRGVLKRIFAENGIEHMEIRGETQSILSRHQPRADRAAHCTAAGNGGPRALPGRAGYRWRRRPHRRGSRRRQLRRLAQNLLGHPARGC